MSGQKTCAVIGGGPAGLMAAETLAGAGCAVTVYDRMPSVGRKFLMAGIGGLNLTHSEELTPFKARYRGGVALGDAIEDFPPQALRDWSDALGQETFVGTSGRVFPKSFKASPLLRAWLGRLTEQGVTFRTRHHWTGWSDGALAFETPEGNATERADAVILAMGGASWSRLGSDGGWRDVLAEDGVAIAPFRPSNCGFITGWREHVGSRFAGTPLKSVAFTFAGETVLGEAVITEDGIEGGAIYALSAPLRDEVERTGHAVLYLDFKPNATVPEIAKKLRQTRSGDSMSNRLRKLKVSPAAIAILREGAHPLPQDEDALAAAIKAAPVTVRGVKPIDRAISSAGGVQYESINDRFMLVTNPGVFVAGEMLDWEAPTGGYLIQGCFASGREAAHGAIEWLNAHDT